MFTFDRLAQHKSHAFDHGWDCAWTGVERNNPYIVNSVEWHQFEWGYNEAEDTLSELDEAPEFRGERFQRVVLKD